MGFNFPFLFLVFRSFLICFPKHTIEEGAMEIKVALSLFISAFRSFLIYPLRYIEEGATCEKQGRSFPLYFDPSLFPNLSPV